MAIRMRTISGIYASIHEIDSASEVSRNFIRNLVLSGKIKGVVKAGSKYLISLDAVLEYLENPLEDKEETKPIYGIIRKING